MTLTDQTNYCISESAIILMEPFSANKAHLDFSCPQWVRNPCGGDLRLDPGLEDPGGEESYSILAWENSIGLYSPLVLQRVRL